MMGLVYVIIRDRNFRTVVQMVIMTLSLSLIFRFQSLSHVPVSGF